MRREPPPLATWMLENLTLDERDEALNGDLTEEYRSGRSDSWFWRQVVAACVVSWVTCLHRRRTVITFAAVWSMLAPAWKVLCDQIQDSGSVNHSWHVLGPLWILPSFSVWLALHSIFLWAGIFVYSLCFTRAATPERLRRALLAASLLFVPAMGTVFVLMNLYSFPGLVDSRLAATPLKQILDLRMPADVLRIPYFAALLYAFWRLIPRPRHSVQSPLPEPRMTEPRTAFDTSISIPAFDSFNTQRFVAFMVATGLMNAMIAAFLLCRLHESQHPSLVSLLIRAISHVAVGVTAGAAGSWLYWRSLSRQLHESARPPFPLFALICAAGWVWVPSMVIFSEHLSVGTGFVAMIGAFTLGLGLRSTTALAFTPATAAYRDALESGPTDLFAESLYPSSVEPDGYVIAVALYAAVAALIAHWIYTSAILLALIAFVFAWKRVSPPDEVFLYGRELRRAGLRFAFVVIPAVFVTTLALLDGVAQHNVPMPLNPSIKRSSHQASASSAHSLDGYESVVLWPYSKKNQLLAPIPLENSLLTPGLKRPVTIRFDGAYWYLQPPKERPGLTAHEAHGTPFAINIKSNNSYPILMRAHQRLSAEVPLARCAEIDIESRIAITRPALSHWRYY